MQEQQFLWDSLLAYVSGDSARNDFFRLYTDSEALAQEYRICGEALNFLQIVITPSFAELPDVRGAVRRCAKDAMPSLGEAFGLYKSLVQWEELSPLQHEDFPLLKGLYEEAPLPPLRRLFQYAFEEDGSLADGASPELKRIRGLKKSLRKKIERSLQAAFQSEDIAEKHLAFREGRYVLPYKSGAKNRVDGIVHGYSATGQTAYIEPKEIVALNNELLSVDDLEQREIDRLLREWGAAISGYIPELEWLLTRTAYLESIFAKARFARDHKAVFPEITYDRTVALLEAFNPFLLLKKGRTNTVPVDFAAGGDVRGVIISGPNAGGKSAALKTLGLFCTMMSYGLPLTARKARLPLFRNILIEMGDHQSLDDELSTFSAHLSSLNSILHTANEDTLIIIDEIAHATDPAEGEALAAAVVDALLETGAFFAISTHYRGLKEKALAHTGIKLYATGFDEDYRPLYTLLENTIGESYALKIAERMGFDKKILNNAERIKEGSLDEKEKILARIGAFESRLHTKELLLFQKERTLLTEEEEFHKTLQEFEKEKEEIRLRGLEAVDRELNQRLRELSALRREMKTAPKQAERILEDVRAAVGEHRKAQNEALRKHPKDFSAGQSVYISTLGKNALIEEVFTHEVRLRVGGLKFTFPKTDLFEADLPLKDTAVRVFKPAVRAESSIDLRGKLISEALPQLESALHKALNAGLEEFSIIHGKGTGALQKAVHSFLKNTPEAADVKFALPQDGGSGKTIVKFL